MKTRDDYWREGYDARTWRLSECPYSRADCRDAWQAGAWAWQQDQRRTVAPEIHPAVNDRSRSR